LALSVAAQYNGEIISADSRQIYRQMDIGTAKPTPAELAQVPHHLIDVVAPDQVFTLAQYRDAATWSEICRHYGPGSPPHGGRRYGAAFGGSD
jgi:tRNA A37 N6-isopentenylltransferase MiaA